MLVLNLRVKYVFIIIFKIRLIKFKLQIGNYEPGILNIDLLLQCLTKIVILVQVLKGNLVIFHHTGGSILC
jgi:hypothetical protein